MTASTGNAVVAADAHLANLSVADSIPVAEPSSKRKRTNAAVNNAQNNVPPTFDKSKWRNGRHDIDPIPVFGSSML